MSALGGLQSKRDPMLEAQSLIFRLEACKSSGVFRFVAKDDAKLIAQLDASDRAIDLMVKDWRKLMNAKDKSKLIKALDYYYAAQREQEEDDILAQADRIRAKRGAT